MTTDTPPMEVVLLGTGYPLPDPDRAGPATLVRAAGMHLLFDAGRGVLMRLRGAGSGPVFVHHVFLTHLHSDHMTDLNDLLTIPRHGGDRWRDLRRERRADQRRPDLCIHPSRTASPSGSSMRDVRS